MSRMFRLHFTMGQCQVEMLKTDFVGNLEKIDVVELSEYARLVESHDEMVRLNKSLQELLAEAEKIIRELSGQIETEPLLN